MRTVPRLVSTLVLAAMMALVSVAAYAQGGVTAAISGTVVDASGAVIPGAEISVKNNATAGVSTAVSNENGTFTIPALNPGIYTATITLMGFKTVVLENVVLNAGTPASFRAVLEVGALEETVTVAGGSEIVQTQTSSVASTMNANMIMNLPLGSRTALNAVVGLPGVNTPGGTRASTINGLPQSTINITLDGMNIQDNYLKTTDGFFARLNPTLDAIEEVTVTTAANGADSGGQGSSQIRMVTRSGSNRFSGSGYYYLLQDSLNANTWFNNRDLAPDPKTGKAPKTELIQHQPGFRVGGPISVPKLFSGRDKAFFFVNYEESRSPRKVSYRRNLLTTQAQQGLFSYNTSTGVNTVDVLALATRNGHIATLDPTVTKQLNDIRASTSAGTLSALSDPNVQELAYQNAASNYTPKPTVRVDYNLTQRHRLTGSFNYQHVNSAPDTTNSREPRFPGFPHTASQQSTRYTTSEALRSTLGANLVNEARFGGTGGATLFSPELVPSMWDSGQLGGSAGYHFAINGGANSLNIANPQSTSGISAREASTKVFEDTLSWIKGNHSVSTGMSFLQADLWLMGQTLVPTVDFGIASGDPADTMFTTGNFPGANSNQLDGARELYSLLVGRINSITGAARFNEDTGQYELLGRGYARARMRELGFFAQDSWRLRSNLTVNAGLRYELQLPFYPMNDAYYTASLEDVFGVSGVGNLFKPGTLSGQRPTFDQFSKGTRAFDVDRNNWAPSLGFAWVPGARGGLIGGLLGEEGDTVFRGGYAIAYNRPGMSDFSDVYGANPGLAISNPDRTTGANTLILDGASLPLLFRQSNRLGPAPFPSTPQTPFTEVITGDVNIFARDLQVPYSQTWTAGIQRKLTRDLVVEARYVGTRHLQQWDSINYNEVNVVENGFLQEFRNAQTNLQAHVAAGCGITGGPTCSFAYRGPGTGTLPLPIYLAYFGGFPASRAGETGLYTSSSFTSTNFTNPLAKFNPNPYTPAGTNSNTGLDGSAGRRANAALSGLPVNFFRVNPDLLGGANVTGNGGATKYNALQLDLRKRMSGGLQFQGSYVYGVARLTNRYSFRTPYKYGLDTGGEGGVTHALKLNWVYELPFGQGRRFLSSSNGFVDRLVGGWSISGIARVQSGQLLDFGNVRIVGMSVDELRSSIGTVDYAVNGLNSTARVLRYTLPKDIVENTVRAFSTSPSTASGYGSFGAPTGRYLAPANGPDCIEPDPGNAFGNCGLNKLEVTGPLYWRVDLSAVKRIRLAGRSEFEFRAEGLNLFNHPNFTPVISTNNNADNYRVTGVQEGSERQIQLVTRFSW